MKRHRDKTKQTGSQRDLLERVRSLKAEENMRRVIEELSKLPFSAPKGYSTESRGRVVIVINSPALVAFILRNPIE